MKIRSFIGLLLIILTITVYLKYSPEESADNIENIEASMFEEKYTRTYIGGGPDWAMYSFNVDGYQILVAKNDHGGIHIYQIEK